MLKKVIRSKVVEASFWSILSELTLKVITPVTYLFLVKFLAPSDFVAVSVITTIVAFLVIIADLGVSKLIVQNNDFEGVERENFIHHGMTISIIIGLFLMILLNMTIDLIVNHFSIQNNRNDLILLSFNIPFLAINGTLLGLLKKSFNFKKIFRIRLISIIFPSLLTIAMVYYGFGITAIIISQLLSSIISVIMTYYSGTYRYRPYYSKVYNKLIFGNSLWNSFEQIFTWLPLTIDIFLMNKFLTKTELGLYTTSRTLFTSAIALSLGAITPVAFSLYSKHNTNIKRLLMVFKETHYLIFLLASILGIMVFSFFEILEPIIFNNKWNGVGRITSIVFLMLSLNYFVNPFQDLYNSIGNFKKTSIIVSMNLILSIPFLYFSVQYGLLIYILVRFSLLFFKIIPITIGLKKIDKDLNIIDFFISTKLIWLFIILNIFTNELVQNKIIVLIIFLISLISMFYLDRKRIINMKNVFS